MSTLTLPPIKTSESTLTTSDNQTLYTKTWHPPTPKPLARLIFIHGFSDHINFYGPLFPTLASQGIKTYAYDQRGWGRSVQTPAQKGLTGPTPTIMRDITEFINSLPKDEDAIPLFVMGHSMGGGEILYYVSNAEHSAPKEIRRKIRGVLAESPYLRLHVSEMPWKATVLAGKILGKLVPRYQMLRPLDSRRMSRDPEVCREWEGDPLCHDTGTLESLAAMIDRAADLEKGKVVIRDNGEKKVSLWIGFGSGDTVLDFEACKRWFESKVQVADKEFRIYDGWYHKLHAEPGEDKYKFARDVSDWILARSGTGEDRSSTETTKSKL